MNKCTDNLTKSEQVERTCKWVVEARLAYEAKEKAKKKYDLGVKEGEFETLMKEDLVKKYLEPYLPKKKVKPRGRPKQTVKLWRWTENGSVPLTPEKDKKTGKGKKRKADSEDEGTSTESGSATTSGVTGKGKKADTSSKDEIISLSSDDSTIEYVGEEKTEEESEPVIDRSTYEERVTVTFPEQPFHPFRRVVLWGEPLGEMMKEVKELRGWPEAEFYLYKFEEIDRREVSPYDSLMSLGRPPPPFWFEAILPGTFRFGNRGIGPVEVLCKTVQRQAPPLRFHMEETQPMDILYNMCARALKVPRDEFSLSFDGETLKPQDTPASLDYASRDIIEIHFKKQ